MQVNEALRDLSALSGARVTIEGIFVMKKDAGYIVTSEDDIDNQDKAISVDVPDLKRILFARVPALGGSQFSYCDEAKITGVLAAKSDGDFPCAIVEVVCLEIYKYGEQLVAIP
jgi:hypothetical protein